MQSLKLSESFKELFTNPAYVLLLIVYGIILGVFNSILVLLNQIVTEYYHVSTIFSKNLLNLK